MNVYQFAKSHATDKYWVEMMASQEVPYLTRGMKGKLYDWPAEVVGHLRNGIYEFRTSYGITKAYGSHFVQDRADGWNWKY